MEEIHKALVIQEKMVQMGVFPNAPIYDVLVSELCKKGMLPFAKKLLVEMLVQNILPDEFVNNTLIDGLVRNDDVGETRRRSLSSWGKRASGMGFV